MCSPSSSQALAGDGADEQRIGVGQAQLLAALLVQEVGLVEDQRAGRLPRADLLEDLIDGAAHQLELRLGGGAVEHVQDEIRAAGLLEGGRGRRRRAGGGACG